MDPLTTNADRVLQYLIEHGPTSYDDLHTNFTDISSPRLRENLASLVKQGYIRKHSDGKWAGYVRRQFSQSKRRQRKTNTMKRGVRLVGQLRKIHVRKTKANKSNRRSSPAFVVRIEIMPDSQSRLVLGDKQISLGSTQSIQVDNIYIDLTRINKKD